MEPKHIALTPMQGKINALAAYLDANLAVGHSIDELASRFHISKYYLCHRFKEQTGLTVMEYVAAGRIRSAQSLMEAGLSSIEAAFAVGYNSYSVFYRHFTRHTGASPRALRRAWRAP